MVVLIIAAPSYDKVLAYIITMCILTLIEVPAQVLPFTTKSTGPGVKKSSKASSSSGALASPPAKAMPKDNPLVTPPITLLVQANIVVRYMYSLDIKTLSKSHT